MAVALFCGRHPCPWTQTDGSGFDPLTEVNVLGFSEMEEDGAVIEVEV